MSKTNNPYRRMFPVGVPYSTMGKDLNENLFAKDSLSELMVDVIKNHIQAIRNQAQPSQIHKNSSKN